MLPQPLSNNGFDTHAHNELCVKKDLERFEQKSKGGLTRVQTSEDII